MKKSIWVILSNLFFLGICVGEPQVGLNTTFHIDKKLFPKTRDYYKKSVPKKVYRAYERGDIPKSWAGANKYSPQKCIEYNQTEATAVIYVPKNYDGTQKYGMYIHNSPMERGIKPPKEWMELMDKFKLIYISPNKASNKTPHWRRIVLAMDAMASVKAHYYIDDKRVFVGGLSGGGHIGMMCQMLYPEYFQAAISHAAQSYLPRETSHGHFQGLSLSDTKKSPRRKKKRIIISGDKDKNYKEILETSKKWRRYKFEYKFFDVKGMKHTNAPASALEEALLWAGA